jgi:hypothetical protein
LKIALFDLWLANNDRNHVNYNLLIKDNKFVPIDHSEIFDGCRLGSKLSQLTMEDSIISSDLAMTFLNNKGKTEEAATDLIEEFPIFVANCNAALPTIIDAIPGEWTKDKGSLTAHIKSSVIENQVWLKDTISSFSELIHTFIR